MKKLIMYPFKEAIQEVKKDKRLQKYLDQQGLNANIFPFIYATYLFLIIISVMYVLLLYLIIVGVFVTPIGFIPIIPSVLTTWIFILIYTKVYPITKKNYLKSIGYFEG